MVITPKGLAHQMVDAAFNDEGCEVKAMLFYLVDEKGEPIRERELEFVLVRSSARCMVMELKERAKCKS